MVKTRSHSRKSASAKRSYRRRVKSSTCRGKGPAVCRGTRGCKYASGKKRSFCRKTKVTRRHRGGRGKSRFVKTLRRVAVPAALYLAHKAYSRRRK